MTRLQIIFATRLIALLLLAWLVGDASMVLPIGFLLPSCSCCSGTGPCTACTGPAPTQMQLDFGCTASASDDCSNCDSANGTYFATFTTSGGFCSASGTAAYSGTCATLCAGCGGGQGGAWSMGFAQSVGLYYVLASYTVCGGNANGGGSPSGYDGGTSTPLPCMYSGTLLDGGVALCSSGKKPCANCGFVLTAIP